MNCMKCGRETAEDHVFCDSCRDVMAQYPVKPGIAIQLPKHKDIPAAKRAAAPRRRQAPGTEEIIRRLRKRVRILLILWLVTLALLSAAIYPTVSFFMNLNLPNIGQNYSTFSDLNETNP